MSAEFWAAVWGAVVGSLLTGGISFALQMVALREARAQRQQVELERKQGLARSLLFKLIQVFSHLRTFNGHVQAARAAALAAGAAQLTWDRMMPLANTPTRVHYSADEMAMLLALKDDDLFNEIVSSDELHNSMIDVFTLYSARRLDLTDRLAGVMEDAGTGQLQGRFIELNMLIAQLVAKGQSDEDAAWRCLTEFNAAIGQKLAVHVALTPKAAAAAPVQEAQ